MSKIQKLYDDIPNVAGKVAIVTGGNIGLGKITCQTLLQKGAKVYMASRTKAKALEAIEEIKKITGKDQIYWLPIDLSSLASVREAAEEFISKEKELHILVNNAGIMATPLEWTKDGYEMQWGTNVVGPFYLTQKLLPIILSTAAKAAPGAVRVINLASIAHDMAPKGGIDFGDTALKSYYYAEWRRYGQSKLANILLTKEITKRYSDKNIISVAVHPGVIKTQLAANVMDRGWFVNSFICLVAPKAITVEEGAYTQIFAATHSRVVSEKMNGKYVCPFGKVTKTNAYGEDEKLASRLWSYLEKEVANYE